MPEKLTIQEAVSAWQDAKADVKMAHEVVREAERNLCEVRNRARAAEEAEAKAWEDLLKMRAKVE